MLVQALSGLFASKPRSFDGPQTIQILFGAVSRKIGRHRGVVLYAGVVLGYSEIAFYHRALSDDTNDRAVYASNAHRYPDAQIEPLP